MKPFVLKPDCLKPQLQRLSLAILACVISLSGVPLTRAQTSAPKANTATKPVPTAGPKRVKHTVPAAPVYVYRTQAGDTPQSIAYTFLKEPIAPESMLALFQANQLNQARFKEGKTVVLPKDSLFKIPSHLIILVPATAVLTQFTGDVVVRSGQTSRAANKQMVLHEQDTVVAGAQGRAVIVFPDQSRIELNASTQVKLASLQRYINTNSYLIDVQLLNGRTDTEVDPNRETNGRFNIQSRRTVTGVRGTVFRTFDTASDTEQDNAVVEVLRGEVAFSGKQRTIAVGAGLGSVLTGSEPSTPVPLLPAPTWTSAKNTLQYQSEPLPLAFAAGATQGILSITAKTPDAITESFVVKAGQTWTPPKHLTAGEYLLNARSKDAKGLQGQSLIQAFEIVSGPLPPKTVALQQPNYQLAALQEQDPPQPRLTWSKHDDAFLYVVEVKQISNNDANTPNTLNTIDTPTINTATPLIQMRTPFPYLELAQLEPGTYAARIATITLNYQHSQTQPNEIQGSFGTWHPFTIP